MKFGVAARNSGEWSGRGAQACVDLARRADELGYDSIWLSDHVVLPRQPRTPYPYHPDGRFLLPWDAPYYEPLVMINALAAVTARARLGIGVLVMPLRHPVVTAKMLAAADLLSGGRVVLGVGVGWLRDEFEALGLHAEVFERRGAVTDEYIGAVKEMWTNTGPSRYRGEFVDFADVGVFPKPAQKPHPPILIGGRGRHALRRASLLGNGYYGLMSTPEQLAGEVRELRRICAHDRRDPDELEVSLAHPVVLTERPREGERGRLHGSVEQVAEDLRDYGRAGLQQLVGGPVLKGAGSAEDEAFEGLELFAREILPAFAGRGPA